MASREKPVKHVNTRTPAQMKRLISANNRKPRKKKNGNK